MIVFRIHGMTLKERTRIKTSPTAVYIVNIIATAKKKTYYLGLLPEKKYEEIPSIFAILSYYIQSKLSPFIISIH